MGLGLGSGSGGTIPPLMVNCPAPASIKLTVAGPTKPVTAYVPAKSVKVLYVIMGATTINLDGSFGWNEPITRTVNPSTLKEPDNVSVSKVIELPSGPDVDMVNLAFNQAIVLYRRMEMTHTRRF